jgi:hypothetical protein
MYMIHLVTAALILQAAVAGDRPAAKTAGAATDVAVTLNYTGKGTVDAGHKVIAWLFSDANITSASRPLATQVIEKNGSTVTFKNVAATPLYIFAVYDEKGGYTGLDAPPPQGIPCAIYSKGPNGPPVPVKGGAAVKFSFGDAVRWSK